MQPLATRPTCWLIAGLLLSFGLTTLPVQAQTPTPTPSPQATTAVIVDDATQLDPGEVVRIQPGELRQIAFSPDEAILAVASNAGLWIYAPDGERNGTLLSPAPTQGLWWSVDSTLLAATLDDGSLELWQVAERTLLGAIDGSAGLIVTVAWSPDGSQIATGSDDGMIEIWSIAEAVVLETLEGHTDRILNLYWIADGAQLVSAAADGSVRVWGVEVTAPPEPTATPAPTPVPITATVQVDRLNIRSGPGTDFERVGTGLRGESLTVIDQEDDCAWLQVQSPSGVEGWVAGGAQFVALAGACEDIGRVVAPPTPTAAETLPTPTIAAPTAAPTPGATLQPTATATITTTTPGESTATATTPAADAPADPFPPEQGCYLFQNQLPVPLTITMATADPATSQTIELPANQEAPSCFEPGPYTYTIRYQTADGSPAPDITGELTINAGDRFMFPIRAEE